MDFTAFTMQDHYRAVVQERERQINKGTWRRQLDEARRSNSAACCDAYERISDASPTVARKTALDPR